MTWAEDNRAWRERAAQRWSPQHGDSLLLRAWLDAPVAYDGYDPLTIEGALQSVVIIRETGRTPDDVYQGCPRDLPLADVDIPIPVADAVCGGPELDATPLAHASCGWFSPDAVATKLQSWKRADAEHYAAKIVRTSMAENKTQMVLKATVTAQHVDFYVQGDRLMLKDLLRDATVLGAGRSGGLGLVHGWEILAAEPWWWTGPGGRLMRTLPARLAEAHGATRYDLRTATLRAPYWHPRTRCEAAVPVQVLGEPVDPADLRYGGGDGATMRA